MSLLESLLGQSTAELEGIMQRVWYICDSYAALVWPGCRRWRATEGDTDIIWCVFVSPHNTLSSGLSWYRNKDYYFFMSGHVLTTYCSLNKCYFQLPFTNNYKQTARQSATESQRGVSWEERGSWAFVPVIFMQIIFCYTRDETDGGKRNRYNDPYRAVTQ